MVVVIDFPGAAGGEAPCPLESIVADINCRGAMSAQERGVGYQARIVSNHSGEAMRLPPQIRVSALPQNRFRPWSRACKTLGDIFVVSRDVEQFRAMPPFFFYPAGPGGLYGVLQRVKNIFSYVSHFSSFENLEGLLEHIENDLRQEEPEADIIPFPGAAQSPGRVVQGLAGGITDGPSRTRP